MEEQTCWGCGHGFDDSVTYSKCTMTHEGEEINVCVACFEELGGHEDSGDNEYNLHGTSKGDNFS